jgi:DNA-binding SARP family transcriptional activator
LTAPSPRLTLLGGFELLRDDEHVALSTSAQRLLAFVALRERPLQRSFVAGSLWLDSTEERAAASLRSALWRLHGCGIPLMRCEGPQLSLDPDLVVDLREAERFAHRALDRTNGSDLDVDASLLSVDLLPDWYDEWVVYERERFHQLRLRALDALCGRLADAGRLDGALEIGLAAVADDPLRESSHRAVVRVHLADGNIAEAIRQYRLCRRLLNEQLGVEPSERMNELVRGVETVR